MLKLTAFVLGFASACLSGEAQNNTPATLPVIVKAGDVYNPFIEKQSRLYNGVEHLGYAYQIKGHAYFLQKELSIGTVVYDELGFANVLMLYDLLKDQVIIQHLDGFSKVGLISTKVQSFYLLNHHFVRLHGDSASSSPIITGFYDELYNGNIKVLIKRGKIIEETIKDEVEREFKETNAVFIQKDGRYYAIKTYKTLLTVLQDKAPQVKQYLRKNKLKFRNDPENTLLKAAVFYDSINK
ncbi:hypothetical protein A4H97_03205 [Niastella yeongjuensis]|uniref:Uncharacterized protein n=1 Tax=Niastella yeongjuensis TaxID=354355 RepID=A0A1V9EXJ4_9BACT|nr:hypothetical protein [Niastella yeongjuensis]OQP50848.1 hypothetical protein A4H97_03205 [Niastella yeongjuensis]SEN14906.1 hypothetical protein SAMN05660816_00300 [Niastella yeongjuensis]